MDLEEKLRRIEDLFEEIKRKSELEEEIERMFGEIANAFSYESE